MSTDTPVMYWPLVATAREPTVSVRDMIKPPWTVYLPPVSIPIRRKACGREGWRLTPTRFTGRFASGV